MDLLAVFALLAAGLAAFGKTLLGPFVLLKGDLFYFRYAFQWTTVSAWASGRAPFLDPSLGGGEPLLANPSHAALYPGLALYALLPFPLAWNLTAALHVAWAGLGLYVLARRLGAAPPAALAGGLVFALSGPLLSTVSFYVVPQTASWLPWALALAHRAFLRGGRAVPLAGLALAMQLLVPEPLVVLGTWLVLFGAWGVGVAAGDPARRRRRALDGLAMAAVGLLVPAAQTLPAILWLPRSTRAGGVDFERSAALWSLPPGRLAELVLPGFFGSSTGTTADELWGGPLSDSGIPLLSLVYLGMLPLVLLPCALTRRAGRAAGGLGALALLLALGRHTPLGAALFHALPPLRVARYPEKWLVFAALAAAVVTALGARAPAEDEAPRRMPLLGLGLASLTLAAAQTLAPALATTAAQRGAQAWSALHAWGAALAAAAVLALLAWRRRERLAWAFPVVAALDLGSASRLVDFSVPAALVRDVPALVRAVPALPDAPVFHRGLDEPARYDTAGAEPLGVMQAAAHPLAGVPWGLRYAVHEDVDRAGFGLAAARNAAVRTRFPAPDALDALRRAGVKHVVTLAPVASPGLALVASVPIGPRASASVYALDGGAEARWLGGRGTATLVERAPHDLVVETAGDAPGAVVLARNALPGWSLTLDGAPARLGATRDGWLAFQAPAGRHRAALRYVPPGLTSGIVVSALGLVLAAALGFRRRRPQR